MSEDKGSMFGTAVPGASGPSVACDASTVVVLRDGAAGPELLMVRRKKGSSFMADAFVFPGGRVDDSDASSHPVDGAEGLQAEARLAALAADGGHAVTLAVAAIRELFEEAGVLIAVGEGGAKVATDGDPWFREARDAVHQGMRGFREILAERDYSLAVGELAFFARWVTPVTEPRRFDARFFLARMPAGQTAMHNEEELVEQRWATPRAILDDYAAGKLKLPPPTLWHLTDLAKHGTVDAALAWARKLDVTTVRPKLAGIDGLPAIVLPWDSEYPSFPGDTSPIPRDHPIAGPTTRYLLVEGKWTARSV